MRIWSKRLIPVLPTKQLKAMRYELGDMIIQYPNIKNPLVKFANNYHSSYLGQYFVAVCRELDNRGIKKNVSYDVKMIDIAIQKDMFSDDIYCENLQFKEDNDRYLKQCYYNLQEKYDRGIVSKEEWELIHKNIYGLIKEYLFKEEI